MGKRGLLQPFESTRPAPPLEPFEDWDPKFLCYSIRGPIILSDGRMTTCTLDHEGQNAIGSIYEEDFDTLVAKYGATRLSAMADPSSKPMCFKCYHKLPRWKDGKVPRADWIHTGCSSREKQDFLALFDPHNLRLNLELSSKCNLRCIGCSVAHPEFRDTRAAPHLDLAGLQRWVGDQGRRISHVRLYHMGETWLHPEWEAICRFLKTENPAVTLFTSTNGMPMQANGTIERALDSGIDHIMFSIHGATQASAEKYMGTAFKLDVALATARKLADLRDARGSSLYLSWKYVIFSWNDSAEEIREARQLCDEAGFDEIHFSITSQPSPSPRLFKGSPDWTALQNESAALWKRGEDYLKTAPMSALIPGQKHRDYEARVARHVPAPLHPPAPSPAVIPQGTRPATIRSAALNFLHRHLPLDREIQRGIANVREGRPATGSRQLARALPIAKNAPAEAWFRLGEAHLALHRFPQALRAFESAIQLQGAHVSEFSHLGRARTLRALDRWEEACAAYESALQARLRNPARAYGEDIHLELGAVLQKLGRETGAKTNFRLWREVSYYRHVTTPRSIYCPIPKNACTALKTAFVQNSSRAEAFQASPSDAHQFLRDPQNKFRLENLDLLGHPKYLSFIVLRNPFHRLASAYANLFVRPLKWHALPDPSARSAVLEIQRARGRTPDAAHSATFEELVHYIARTPDHDLDYHFRPQRAFYDTLDAFDFVGRVEAMDEVRQMLADRLKWSFGGVETTNRTPYAASLNGTRHHRTSPHALQKMNLFPSAHSLFTDPLRDLVRERYAADFAAYEEVFGIPARLD
jgi:tetratricopeptide (TPR) repeat protein